MSRRGSQLARVQALEHQSEASEEKIPWNERHLPWLILESRNDGQRLTDAVDGTEYTGVDLVQLQEDYRLVIVKVPPETEYRTEVAEDDGETNGEGLAGRGD